MQESWGNLQDRSAPNLAIFVVDFPLWILTADQIKKKNVKKKYLLNRSPAPVLTHPWSTPVCVHAIAGAVCDWLQLSCGNTPCHRWRPVNGTREVSAWEKQGIGKVSI